MGAKFIYDGIEYELSRQFDLGGRLSRSRNQSRIQTYSGRVIVLSKGISSRRLRFILEAASIDDRAIVEDFYWNVVNGSEKTFKIETTGTHAEPWQIGGEVYITTPSPQWVTIRVGQTINGQTIKLGQFLQQRNYTYHNLRFIEDSLVVEDAYPTNGNIEFEVRQEFDE